MNERMNFFEAFKLVADTKRRVRYWNGSAYTDWHRHEKVGLISDADKGVWNPELCQLLRSAWEVESEKLPNDFEFTVWGVCDDNGTPWLFTERPIRKRPGFWDPRDVDTAIGIVGREHNLFPKGPVKLKLVLDNEEK